MKNFDSAQVSEHEHGIVRVFLASYQLSMEIAHVGTYERLCDALGIDNIDSAQVQQLKTNALTDMTVTEFLRAGYDVNEDDAAQFQNALDRTAKDNVLLLILRSTAFVNRPVTMNTNGEAKLIATLREPNADVSFKTLPNPDPDPTGVLVEQIEKKRPSDAAMGGRVATIVLIVLGLLVWLMIRIAA